jgi:hypothetical protein
LFNDFLNYRKTRALSGKWNDCGKNGSNGIHRKGYIFPETAKPFVAFPPANGFTQDWFL